MRQKLLIFLALLCTFVQTSWALDVWDGSISKPEYDGNRNGWAITKGSELAWIQEHWTDHDLYTNSFFLDDDLDLSNFNWTPLGQGYGGSGYFNGTFYGNNHTINLSITGVSDNYQGLFSDINTTGRVQDLHVSGLIACSNSRLVGAIAGESYGTIINCWVSADVSSGYQDSWSINKAKVGGITGENHGNIVYCCMTGDVVNHDAYVGGLVGYNNGGTINHCTLYGNRYSGHDQSSPFVGYQGGNLWNIHAEDLLDDTTLDNYLSSFSSAVGPELYRYAIQYPYPVNIINKGNGAVDSDIPGARVGKTVRLDKLFGSMEGIFIQGADGNRIIPSINEAEGYCTFTMPRKGVVVNADFSGTNWLEAHAGTLADPYRISSTEDWNIFAYYVHQGHNFYQQYVKLESDITVRTSVGMREESIHNMRPFCGTFLGEGHTLTADLSSTATGTSPNEQGVAPFHCIFEATIKNLTVDGTISSASYHTAGLVGFAYSTSRIENCTVTATLNISSNHAGGIIGHGENSATTIKDCIFAGTINGVGTKRTNVGAIWGWSNVGTPVFQNCMERGTYTNISSMHPVGLHGASGSITDCYYLNAQIGTPDMVCTVSGAYQVQTTAPENEIYKTVTAADGTPYYLLCEVSGIKEEAYVLKESSAEPNVTVTCKGTALVENTDYTVAYANNREAGNASVTISGKDGYSGKKTMPFRISSPDIMSSWEALWNGANYYNLHDGHTYKVVGNVMLDWDRVTVHGNVVLYLSAGSRLECYYGIELSEGNTLTIEGTGSLVVSHSTHEGAGIGAHKMGTLIINGGNIDVQGGTYAAGIGGNINSIGTGRIIINGGVIKAQGGWGGAGIGGGDRDWKGDYGRSGDIVINGGQVTVRGGDEAPAIGRGHDSANSGALTLSWTNPDDFLDIQGPNGLLSVTFADGKQFLYDDGNQTIAKPTDLSSKRLVPYVPVEGIAGSGTENDPYIINSDADWEKFATSVTYGNSYSGKYVKLTADINVTQQCGYVKGGTPCKPFSGTFDGQGHTITANISANQHQGTAIFSYINGATIKNLTVAGTITSTNPHTGGLVGFAGGTNTIEKITVNAALNIRSDYAGGIVGNGQTSATTVKDCIFAGTITGIAGNRGNVGGIYGWSAENDTHTLQNCLEKGTYTNISSMHPVSLQNDKGTISQCYYLNQVRGIANAGNINGAYKVSTSPIDGEISKQKELLDGVTYYVPCVISGVDEFYELAEGGTLSITPTVKWSDDTALSFSTDYTATLDNDATASSTASVTTKGEHTLVINGTGNYTGSKSITFQVFDPIAGTGTAENPYLIRGVDEWNLFATMVNRGVNGNDFSGQYVQLDEDLTVTSMVGASADKPFKGTFIGNGKTLTFNLGSTSEPFDGDFCAPFRYVNGATIRNLKVAGNIYPNKMYGAGLVGNTAGTTTITDCQVSTIIHCTSDGGFHGGIVGMPSGPLNITNCIYSGRLVATQDTSPCSGFVGWAYSQTINISSSLYAPNTALAVSDDERDITLGSTFVRGDNKGSISSDCFYTQRLTEVQGTRIYTEALDGELCMKAQAADGNWYYLPVTVSGIKNSYTLEGTSLSITPTIAGFGDTNPALTTDFTATLNGNPASLPLNITSKGNYTLVLTAAGGSTTYTGSKTIEFLVSTPLDGEGTKESPYLISSADDWNSFASRVAEGETYEGKFLKLNGNISVSKMVGTNSAHSFSGTFTGSDDYTLTFNAGSAEAPFNEEYCAPFRYVCGDTIQNLKVAGDIYTSRKYAAGLVGNPSGSSTITGCQVSTIIHSSVAGDGSHGGIVAMPSGALNIDNSIFDGRLLTTGGTTHCGGFVGWANGQTINVSNSLYAPVPSSSSAESPITVGATFVRSGSVGNYCYYTAPLGDAQGTMVYATRPEGELCMQAKAADNNMYYLPCTVSGVLAAYDLEEDVSITPAVTGLGYTAAFTTDFTATLDGNDVTSFPISTTERGEHTLVLTGKGDNYSGSKTLAFVVTAALEGQGTAESPYLIRSTDDWALFATKVAGGMDYNGKYVKLNDDITISTPVGEREDKPFCGIFLGNDKTLTANISNTNADTQGTAPFRYIKDATIQDMNVSGTIASNSRYTGGLVGFADGTNSITNSTVTATLNVANDYAAGFVGNGLSSTTTLQNCIFAGTINGVGGNRGNMAGIWGLGGTPKLTDCMEKGTYTNVGSLHPIGLQNNDGTISRCYYLTAQKGAPDHACTVSGAYLVSTTPSAGEINKPVTAVDGTYYMLCTVGGVKSVYAQSDEAITLTPTVTAADGTTLTTGTDFTYATNPATVKDAGDYTLTVTAQGDTYTGTKDIHFSVSDNVAITSESTTLNSGNYNVYENVTIDSRITISGDVVLNLGEGTRLTASKGIELSKGNKLTINGPGELVVNNPDAGNAGIGAVEVGTLVINGGSILAVGLQGAALGGSKDNTSGGSITINGGYVFAMGSIFGTQAAAIGGGYAEKEGDYGVCGDIVINGGQVVTLSKGEGIGPGYHDGTDNRSNSGTLTLGWTNADDEYLIRGINTSTGGNHLQSISFIPGKRFFYKDSKVVAPLTASALSNNTIVPLLAPTDNGNNSQLISSCNGMAVPVMLEGRTLYKDGGWNTLCLPFDLTLSGSPLDGAVARPLDEASISESTLNLTFGDAVTVLKAGQPYIIKWTRADDYVDDDAHNIVNPLFSGVTIDATDRSFDNEAAANQRVRFVGTYNSQSFDAEDKSILLMGSGNTLYYPTTGASIGAQRAYFKIGDGSTQVKQLNAFSIDFGDDDTATGIISLTPGLSPKDEASDGWYTLDGRRLSGEPRQKGVYINNGIKRMIK